MMGVRCFISASYPVIHNDDDDDDDNDNDDDDNDFNDPTRPWQNDKVRMTTMMISR